MTFNAQPRQARITVEDDADLLALLAEIMERRKVRLFEARYDGGDRIFKVPLTRIIFDEDTMVLMLQQRAQRPTLAEENAKLAKRDRDATFDEALPAIAKRSRDAGRRRHR